MSPVAAVPLKSAVVTLRADPLLRGVRAWAAVHESLLRQRWTDLAITCRNDDDPGVEAEVRVHAAVVLPWADALRNSCELDEFNRPCRSRLLSDCARAEVDALVEFFYSGQLVVTVGGGWLRKSRAVELLRRVGFRRFHEVLLERLDEPPMPVQWTLVENPLNLEEDKDEEALDVNKAVEIPPLANGVGVVEELGQAEQIKEHHSPATPLWDNGAKSPTSSPIEIRAGPADSPPTDVSRNSDKPLLAANFVAGESQTRKDDDAGAQGEGASQAENSPTAAQGRQLRPRSSTPGWSSVTASTRSSTRRARSAKIEVIDIADEDHPSPPRGGGKSHKKSPTPQPPPSRKRARSAAKTPSPPPASSSDCEMTHCAACDRTFQTAGNFREHMSFMHFKKEIMAEFVKRNVNGQLVCAICGYTGSSVARHVGTVHRAVDRFMHLLPEKMGGRGGEHDESSDETSEDSGPPQSPPQPPAKRRRTRTVTFTPPRLPVRQAAAKPVVAPAPPLPRTRSRAKSVSSAAPYSTAEMARTRPSPPPPLSLCCFHCRKALHSRGSLKSHVSTHFSKDMKKRFDVKGKRCPLCPFAGKYPYQVVYHLGVEHKFLRDYIGADNFREVYEERFYPRRRIKTELKQEHLAAPVAATKREQEADLVQVQQAQDGNNGMVFLENSFASPRSEAAGGSGDNGEFYHPAATYDLNQTLEVDHFPGLPFVEMYPDIGPEVNNNSSIFCSSNNGIVLDGINEPPQEQQQQLHQQQVFVGTSTASPALLPTPLVTGESGTGCGLCGKSMGTATSLRKHLVTHFAAEVAAVVDADRPGQCPLCAVNKKYKSYLIYHLAVDHEMLKQHLGDDLFNEIYGKASSKNRKRSSTNKTATPVAEEEFIDVEMLQ